MIKKLKNLFIYDTNKYENILDDPNSKFGSFLDKFILILVILFPLVMIFESLDRNYLIYKDELFIFEIFISFVFAIEYIYRFLKAKVKYNFFINPLRIIDLLSFAPFFLWLFSWWFMLQIIKVLRIFRIFRLFKRIPLTSWFLNSLKNYYDEYIAVFTLYFVILFIGSFFVYLAEKDVIWTTFNSLWDSLWWWLVTTATLGYWDMVPQTINWKMFWSVLIFLGPLLWWLISAVTIMVFMETSKRLEKENDPLRWKKMCNRCKTRNPKKSNYCIKCWERFK